MDWSSRSFLAMRWLGKHMVPFVGWAHTRQWRLEAIVMHECVMSHAFEFLLRRYHGRTHFISCFPLWPSILGHPTTRTRRFTLAIIKSIIRATLAASPWMLFRFTTMADGQIYFAAEKYELDAFLAMCQAETFHDTLPAGARQRPVRQTMFIYTIIT